LDEEDIEGVDEEKEKIGGLKPRPLAGVNARRSGAPTAISSPKSIFPLYLSLRSTCKRQLKSPKAFTDRRIQRELTSEKIPWEGEFTFRSDS
jgi:hypothetical protein